jgi:hypothetical protein
LVTAPQAYACSCIDTDPFSRVSGADLIVLGTVQNIEDLGVREDTLEGRTVKTFLGYDLLVAVEEYLKGSGPDALTVHDDSLQSSACSPFDPDSVGTSFLLYLKDRKDGTLGTSICEGSGFVTDKNRDRVESHIEQIRQIVAGTLVPTETVSPSDLVPTPTVAPAELPRTGSSAEHSFQASIPLLAAAAAMGLIGLVGAAAGFWYRTIR